jgi:asparagine synthase (glutamine-hydrolysing)
MSGFFGILLAEPIRIPEGIVSSVGGRLNLHHKGVSTSWERPGCLLGMIRHSHTSYSGPFTNESSRIQVVGAGDLYNHQAIRRQLTRSGHEFSTEADLEVIAHLMETAWLDWELGFKGSFAFAAWDDYERKLRLGCDRFGLSPLYWLGNELGIAFASSPLILRALFLAWGHLESTPLPALVKDWAEPAQWKLHPEALHGYLGLAVVPPSSSFFQGVQRLPQAGRLLWTPHHPPTVEHWWQPRFTPKRRLTLAKAITEFKATFRNSLQDSLCPQAPLQVLLKPTVESAFLLSELSHLVRKQLTAYALACCDTAPASLAPLQQLASQVGVPLQEIRLDRCCPEDLFRMVRPMHQPLGMPETWTSWAIAQQLGSSSFSPPLPSGEGSGVRVSSEGCQEVLGGYPEYRLYQLSRCLPKRMGIPFPVFPPTMRRGAFGAHPSCASARSITSLLQRILCRIQDGFRSEEDLIRRYRYADPSGKMTAMIFPGDQPDADGMPMGDPTLAGHDRLLWLEWATGFPHLCQDVQMWSQGSSRQIRLPWLDPTLYEWLAHLPSHLKINGGMTKWLLWKTVAQEQGGGMPFLLKNWEPPAIPVDRLLAVELAPLVRDVVLEKNSRISGSIDLMQLRRLFEAHRARRIRIGRYLWGILILELWLREHHLGV